MFSDNITSPLFTDLYQLTMMAGYHKNEINNPATFSVYLRPAKGKRSYFVACGLESIITYIENLKFSEDDIEYLKSLNLFEDSFLSWLENYRFSGDIHAMEEGSIFFGNEPVIEITAPIMEVQLLETMVVNTLNIETMIATKAARCCHSAQTKPVIDFSLRRTQGRDAGQKVARSSYIAGFSGTSNLLAGKTYGIPVSGTMAHSFVTAFENEEESFRAFSEIFPENCILLVDTYDVIKGTKNAVKIGKELENKGYRLIGVRLDSGDINSLSKEVRKILDSNNLQYVKIFASGGFDEFSIAEILENGAEIDGFGVGTRMGVSADFPYHDTVFKLAWFNGKNVRKFSENKVSLAGQKQVFRIFDKNGSMEKDIIGTRDEKIEGAVPLLKKVVENGLRINEPSQINKIRKNFLNNFSKLDNRLKNISTDKEYKVKISDKLTRIQPS